MSKVKIQGHASGTGVLTVTAPNTSTDRTITLPDSTGTILDENSSLPAANLTGTVADARFPATLPAVSAANLTNVPKDTTVGGRKNILKNGGFDVWQRGTSFSHTSGKNFICDRWWVNPSSVGGTQTRQSASLDGFNYALRIQRTSGQSGTGLVYLNTEMESADSMQFRGKKVTLSFYARKGANFSQSSSQLTSNLATGTGTDQTLQTGFTGGANVISQNNTLTTSWQKFTHTTSSVLASTVNQIAVQFTHSPAGTAGAADYYEITGVQLEVGSTATDFEHRSFGEELALCQRYYQKSNNNSVFACFSNGANQVQFSPPLNCPMRASPTISWSGSGNSTVVDHDSTHDTGDNNVPVVSNYTSFASNIHMYINNWSSALTDMRIQNLYIGGKAIVMESEL